MNYLSCRIHSRFWVRSVMRLVNENEFVQRRPQYRAYRLCITVLTLFFKQCDSTVPESNRKNRITRRNWNTHTHTSGQENKNEKQNERTSERKYEHHAIFFVLVLVLGNSRIHNSSNQLWVQLDGFRQCSVCDAFLDPLARMTLIIYMSIVSFFSLFSSILYKEKYLMSNGLLCAFSIWSTSFLFVLELY